MAALPHGEALARLEKLEADFNLLLEALEAHGNAEGTEHQLDRTTAFLRLAWDLMSLPDKRPFLDHPDVVSFVDEQDITEEEAREGK